MKERSLGERILLWTQIAAYFLGALWAAYTFFYEDVYVPNTAPINVSLAVELKKLGKVSRVVDGQKESFIAIGMSVTATNPSPRTAYLLNSAWIAKGYVVSAVNGSPALFVKNANQLLKSDSALPQFGMPDFVWKNGDLLAVGQLFSDYQLRPGEKIERQLVFQVPANQYDVIQVHSAMPLTEKSCNINEAWTLDVKNGFDPSFFKEGKKGQPDTPMKVVINEDGDCVVDGHVVYQAISSSNLSMWN